MKDMVGVPAPLRRRDAADAVDLAEARGRRPYAPCDAALMTGFRIPRSSFAFIRVPALVMNGAKTDARLKEAARAIAQAIPGAQHNELAGQTHNVKPAVLTPAVAAFLTASIATIPSRS
jgi:pimeloyl-ACP methyl ester carboxylesterase